MVMIIIRVALTWQFKLAAKGDLSTNGIAPPIAPDLQITP